MDEFASDFVESDKAFLSVRALVVIFPRQGARDLNERSMPHYSAPRTVVAADVITSYAVSEMYHRLCFGTDPIHQEILVAIPWDRGFTKLSRIENGDHPGVPIPQKRRAPS